MTMMANCDIVVVDDDDADADEDNDDDNDDENPVSQEAQPRQLQLEHKLPLASTA